MPVTISTSGSHREEEINLSSCSGLHSSTYKQYSTKNIYMCSPTHTHTHKISYYPNPCCTSGLCMCFLGYVCVCVWALRCLQDAQRRTGSLKSFGYKVKRERARDGDKEGRDGRERKATRHNNIHKSRAGAAKCGQQSLYLCDADSPPPHTHFLRGMKLKGEGENVFTLTRTFHRTPFSIPPSPPPRAFFFFFEQYLRVENISSLPLDSVSIHGSCEQGLQPLLVTLNYRSVLSATISPSNLFYV